MAPVGQSRSSTSISFCARASTRERYLRFFFSFLWATSARLACSIFSQEVSNKKVERRLQRRQRVAVPPERNSSGESRPTARLGVQARHGARTRAKTKEEGSHRQKADRTHRPRWRGRWHPGAVGVAVAARRAAAACRRRAASSARRLRARRTHSAFSIGDARVASSRSAATVFGYTTAPTAPTVLNGERCAILAPSSECRARASSLRCRQGLPQPSAHRLCKVLVLGARAARRCPRARGHSRSIRSTRRLVRQTSAAACSTAEATAGGPTPPAWPSTGVACRAACCEPSTADCPTRRSILWGAAPATPSARGGRRRRQVAGGGESIDAEVLRQQRAQRAQLPRV